MKKNLVWLMYRSMVTTRSGKTTKKKSNPTVTSNFKAPAGPKKKKKSKVYKRGQIVGEYKCDKVYARQDQKGNIVYYMIQYSKNKTTRKKCAVQNNYKTKVKRIAKGNVKFY